ncbi:hypothetical protein ACMYZ5_00460 [Bacteroides sp. KG68]|uniref:hypothetical protein n=1 Tax=unclassified Bacteroides TaxID=2646097 RepID=UPI003D97A2B4
MMVVIFFLSLQRYCFLPEKAFFCPLKRRQWRRRLSPRAMRLREAVPVAFGESCVTPLGSRACCLWEVMRDASVEALLPLSRPRALPCAEVCFSLRIAACTGQAPGFVLFS